MPDQINVVPTPIVPDGLVAFVKKDCPTCTLIAAVLRDLAATGPAFRVVTQDDPAFPAGVAAVVDDRSLDHSFLHGIEYTPTLIRFAAGREVERTIGWDAREWRRITGIAGLGAGLPPFQPG